MRKRKLPVEVEPPTPPKEEKKEETPDELTSEKIDADSGYYFHHYNLYMFQDYRMMLNKMMVEQMKMKR